jgi:hypothetical protein
MNATAQQAKAMIAAVQAIADCIRELGSVPSGHLYARVMSHVSLEAYNQIIRILKDAGVVTESAHLLTWTGPQP